LSVACLSTDRARALLVKHLNSPTKMQPNTLVEGDACEDESGEDSTLEALLQSFQQLPPTSRTEYLSRIVPHLSSYEVWHMQKRLENGARLANLADLPPELLEMVLRFLRLPDVLRCLCISKAWYRAWTQPAIISSMYSQFIPEHAPQNDTSLQTFRLLSRPFLRRHLGKPKSTVCKALRYSDEQTFKLDPEYHPSGEYPDIEGGYNLRRFAPLGYGHGRFAWQIHVRAVVLDNLRTLKRIVLELKGPALLHGLSVRRCYLSTSFILFCLNGGRGVSNYM